MMNVKHPSGNYTLIEGFDTIDMAVVEAFFTSEEAYWTKDDGSVDRQRAWKNSNCWSLNDNDGTMIGGFRLITDRSFFGYVADVFILPAHRSQALAEWMLQETFASPEYKKVKRWVLRTKDMQGLYTKLGFNEPIDREWEMEKRR